VIVSVDLFKEVRPFLNAHHYIGADRGGVTISGRLNGEIVAVIIFSPPVRQNMYDAFPFHDWVELSRLCIHPAYHKKNFASWFISRCLVLIKKPVVSYADTSVGHKGTVYKAANFQLHHEVPPDYWYVDSDGYVMRKRTLYGKAKQMGITEKEYAERFGYQKRWGGKKLCYIYPLDRQ
jgi:hypothetical protein